MIWPDRRRSHLHRLRPMRQRVPHGVHYGNLRVPGRAEGHRRPGQDRHPVDVAVGARRPGRTVRHGTGRLRGRPNGGPGKGLGLRLCPGHELRRRYDHRRRSKRADFPAHEEGPGAAAVHVVLPRLGQVRRNLLPPPAAAYFDGQEPYRHAGADDQDLFCQEDGPGSEENRQRGPDALHGEKV